MPLELSAKEQKRLNSVTAVLVPLMFPGTVEAAIERPITGPEALCLVFAGAAGGSLGEVPCVLSLRPRGFGKAEAHQIFEEGIAGLVETKLAKSEEEGRKFTLTAKGLKMYEKINSNLDALKAAPTKK